MTTIVTRAGKGSALSFTEMDANLTNLNNDKLESGSALGTPASGTLTNCTGLPVATGVSGLGSGVATALAANAGASGGFQLYDADIPTTAASQAEMEAGTEAAVRSISPLRVAQAIAALGSAGTLVRTTFTASGNLTFPAGVTQAWVTGQACGGGGGGSTTTPTAGGNGGNVTFGPNGGAVVLTLVGGTGGSVGGGQGTAGGAGGAGGGSGITQGRSGRRGQSLLSSAGGVNPDYIADCLGGSGGSGMFGELGSGGNGGLGSSRLYTGGGGGGAGEQCFSLPVTVTAAQWDVTIGSGGTAGTSGSGGNYSPEAGQAGFLIVEYFS